MLSIVIPTLNEENYLPRLIKSIKQQNYSNYEIIVSDAGSSDKTEQIALDQGCNFTVNSKNQHPSWQRNNGAVPAKGEILLFLDADSVLKENFLTKTVTEFKDRNLDCAAFYIKFNPNCFLYSVFSLVINCFACLSQFISPIGIGAGILVKKKAHDTINGFDTSLLLVEDYDYFRRVSKKFKFRMINSTRLLYSSRRLEQDGKYKTLFQWLGMGLFYFLHIKNKKKIIKYEFGKFKD